MKKLAVTILGVAMVVWTAPVQAFGHHGSKCAGCETCCPSASCAPCAPAVTYVEKTVTQYRNEWREREVPCTVARVVQRVEVVPETRTTMIAVMEEHKHECMVTNCVAREVTEQVTCCRMVPTCCTDPCTGCTHTCCKPETYVKEVKRTVFDQVPMKRVYTTHTCSYKPVTKTVETKRVVCETKLETVMKKERYCVCVPYQTKVKVPVCAPAPCCQ